MAFSQSVQEERDRLHAERERLQSEKQKIDGDLSAITKQLAALDAYDKAINGAAQPPRPQQQQSSSGRRTGIRDQVLDAIKAGHNTPSKIRTHLSLTDKSGGQAVSNAISGLKKDSKIAADDATGGYIAAP